MLIQNDANPGMMAIRGKAIFDYFNLLVSAVLL